MNDSVEHFDKIKLVEHGPCADGRGEYVTLSTKPAALMWELERVAKVLTGKDFRRNIDETEIEQGEDGEPWLVTFYS